MAIATFGCPKCRTEFEAPTATDHLEFSCPTCASQLEAFFFPALYREGPLGVAAGALVDHTEASCFYHPQKQAAQVCDGCGRLICSLCVIDLGPEHLCPNCISSGRKKGKITSLENHRTCYDRIALSLAILGMLFGIVSIFTAPAAIYVSIRHWKSPGSLLGVSRKRFVIAIVLASLEVLFWIAIVILVGNGRRHAT
jgi:hypothetical protein